MAASSDFFDKRNPRAVLKHGILVRYAYYFAGRAGRATQGRVAFIDGYAGEGRYNDGSPGSPLLLATEAKRAGSLGRNVKLAFVEPNQLRCAQLRDSLAASEVEPDQVLEKQFEAVVDELLDRYDRHALLIFVDPFGLAITRPTLERVLRRSSSRQPIDVLYHFSLLTVARMGRAAVTRSEQAESNGKQLHEALGPVGWEQSFEGASSGGEPTEAALTVARRFGRSIKDATGVRSTAIPVRQRPDHLPQYLLMLFSTNNEAHWDFADLASTAYVEWLHQCSTSDYKANLDRQLEQGDLQLFSDPEPDRDATERRLRSEAVLYLSSHLRDVLKVERALRPVDHIEQIYGEMLGRARSTHLRSALQMLHARGEIDDNATQDFWNRTIHLLT